MNLLFDFLKSRRSVRWLGHILGLLAGAGLLWANSGEGVLALTAEFAAFILVIELCISLVDGKKRRLKRLAPSCFPLKNMSEEDRAFVQHSLADSRTAIFRRATLVWVLAFLLVPFTHFFGGPTQDEAFFISLALPVAIVIQATGLELLLKRLLPFFYFESDYAKNIGAWLPTLDRRLRRSMIMPLAIVSAPVAAAFIIAVPLSVGALLWIAAWGGIAALGGAWALSSLVVEPLQDLHQALARFGKGDLQALLDVTSGDELGHATETYNKTVRAIDRRFFVLERFGHSVLPGKSEALFEGGLRLDGEVRAVAVLECAWHNVDESTHGMEAPTRLSTMNRFYEVVQDAVDKAQGAVLDLGEGRVLACWGAPLADENSVQGALSAAWSLQAHLKVWASQQRLRGGTAAQWGLGVSSGQVTLGLVGPRNRQRYSAMGGPVSEVERLAQQPSGPWVDERSAGAARAPFAVQVTDKGSLLIAGPEPETPTAEALGFKPGERL